MIQKNPPFEHKKCVRTLEIFCSCVSDFNNFIENAHHRQKTEMWLVKEEHDERDEEEKVILILKMCGCK